MVSIRTAWKALEHASFHKPKRKHEEAMRLHQSLSLYLFPAVAAPAIYCHHIGLELHKSIILQLRRWCEMGLTALRSRWQQKMLLSGAHSFLPSLKSAGRQLWISLTLTLWLRHHLSFPEPIKDCSDDVGPIQIIRDNLLGTGSLTSSARWGTRITQSGGN